LTSLTPIGGFQLAFAVTGSMPTSSYWRRSIAMKAS